MNVADYLPNQWAFHLDEEDFTARILDMDEDKEVLIFCINDQEMRFKFVSNMSGEQIYPFSFSGRSFVLHICPLKNRQSQCALFCGGFNVLTNEPLRTHLYFPLWACAFWISYFPFFIYRTLNPIVLACVGILLSTLIARHERLALGVRIGINVLLTLAMWALYYLVLAPK